MGDYKSYIQEDESHTKSVTFGKDTMRYFSHLHQYDDKINEMKHNKLLNSKKSSKKKIKKKSKQKLKKLPNNSDDQLEFKQISLPWPFNKTQPIPDAGMKVLSNFASNSLLSVSKTGLTPNELLSTIKGIECNSKSNSKHLSKSTIGRSIPSNIAAYVEQNECYLTPQKNSIILKRKKKKEKNIKSVPSPFQPSSCNESLSDNTNSKVEIGSNTTPASKININDDEIILTSAQYLEDDSLITMTDFDGEISASKLSQSSQIDGVSEMYTTQIETSSKNPKKKKKKRNKKILKKNKINKIMKMINSPVYGIYVDPIFNDSVI